MTLFDEIDRTTNVAFAISVHKRNAATLTPFFYKKTSRVFRNLGKSIILNIFKLTINTILLDPKIPTSILIKLSAYGEN